MSNACPQLPHAERLPLAQGLDAYRARWPQEAATVERFQALLALRAPVFARHCFPAHFTASAWLVSADGARALLTHHRKLERWLQPGGHADGQADTPGAALREAGEESGLRGLVVEPQLFDIDAHRIPARGLEPEHWHYDLRYVVRAAAGGEDFVVGEESHDLAWRGIDALASDHGIDPSIRRMAAKWLQRRTA